MQKAAYVRLFTPTASNLIQDTKDFDTSV